MISDKNYTTLKWFYRLSCWSQFLTASSSWESLVPCTCLSCGTGWWFSTLIRRKCPTGALRSKWGCCRAWRTSTFRCRVTWLRNYSSPRPFIRLLFQLSISWTKGFRCTCLWYGWRRVSSLLRPLSFRNKIHPWAVCGGYRSWRTSRVGEKRSKKLSCYTNASCPEQSQNTDQRMKSPDGPQRTCLWSARRSFYQICWLRTFRVTL